MNRSYKPLTRQELKRLIGPEGMADGSRAVELAESCYANIRIEIPEMKLAPWADMPQEARMAVLLIALLAYEAGRRDEIEMRWEVAS